MEPKLKTPIGIFGGTFDPIHYGHLSPCLEVCESLKLAQIRFVPSYIPPHRESPISSVAMRVAMVKAAISSEPRFVLDEREILRQGSSYMIDTLKSLSQDFPQQPLCLILGMDAFLKIHYWYHWQELLDVAHFIITKRPETAFDQQEKWPLEVQQLYNQHKADEIFDLQRYLYGKIVFQSVTQLAISSSEIRAKLKQQNSVRYLLPDAVLDLISHHHLYL